MNTRATIGAVVVIFALGVWCFAHSEMYCPVYPGIDTYYASGFSEANFKRVSLGLTANEVEGLLGKPLSILRRENGTEEWLFTADGKCKWGDFAWLCRSLVISNGLVISMERSIHYD